MNTEPKMWQREDFDEHFERLSQEQRRVTSRFFKGMPYIVGFVAS